MRLVVLLLLLELELFPEPVGAGATGVTEEGGVGFEAAELFIGVAGVFAVVAAVGLFRLKQTQLQK